MITPTTGALAPKEPTAGTAVPGAVKKPPVLPAGKGNSKRPGEAGDTFGRLCDDGSDG